MSFRVEIPRIGTAAAWRDAARALASNGVAPEEVHWQDEGAARGLFEGASTLPGSQPLKVPRAFIALANTVVWHRDPERFALLYALLLRLRHKRQLMADRADPALARLRGMEKAVHRCQHKMKAFVRFRELPRRSAGRRAFAAWFEPTHHTVEPTAAFFRRRFADMDWCIATPDVTVHCVAGKLTFALDVPRPELQPDATEALWTTYYSHIFNPARLKVQAMTSEMPKKYWKNLPEAAAIPELIAQAERRAEEMAQAAPTLAPAHAGAVRSQRDQGHAPPGPWAGAGGDMTAEIQACTRCPLHAAATQAVPGVGPSQARIMIVGEQPGDHEDLAGRPFVGPAGLLFDQIAQEVGLDRDACYITNAVKHFKYTPRGKRRIHQRPNTSEIARCRWWLDAEVARVAPVLIVAMGAVAAEALTGSGAQLRKRCGRIETAPKRPPVLLTLHPAYALRAPDPAQRDAARAQLKSDLARAAIWGQRAGVT